MNKGQGAIVDALFFMLICSASATLLFYVSSIYGQSVNQQVSAIYNYEYTGNALVSLRAADSYTFWNGLREIVLDGTEEEMIDYIDESGVWEEVNRSSPSEYAFLCFEGTGCGVEQCYPESYDGKEERGFRGEYIAYTSSTRIEPGCRAILKVYY